MITLEQLAEWESKAGTYLRVGMKPTRDEERILALIATVRRRDMERAEFEDQVLLLLKQKDARIELLESVAESARRIDDSHLRAALAALDGAK